MGVVCCCVHKPHHDPPFQLYVIYKMSGTISFPTFYFPVIPSNCKLIMYVCLIMFKNIAIHVLSSLHLTFDMQWFHIHTHTMENLDFAPV